MPELPEVETITRQLNQTTKGLVIQNIKITNKKSFVGNPKDIIDAKIINNYRWAKNIVVDLSNKYHLLIHLKMTGQLIFVDHPSSARGGLRGASKYIGIIVPNKFTHVSFDFKDGSHLYFNDIRKFGWIKLLNSEQLDREMQNIGPDPLASYFKINEFKEKLLVHKNKMIKPVLMDQSVIAGIGNIYAAEACFYAKIRPDRKISTLSDQDLNNLFKGIKKILPLAIKYQGVSADNYVTLEGKQGDYYKKLWVYDCEGKPCPDKCGGKIVKTKLEGRGTYYCSKCQK